MWRERDANKLDLSSLSLFLSVSLSLSVSLCLCLCLSGVYVGVRISYRKNTNRKKKQVSKHLFMVLFWRYGFVLVQLILVSNMSMTGIPPGKP